MQLSALLNKLDKIDRSPRRSIFESIGQGDQYFRTWERDIHPVLCEVALQPDQIQQLFKSIETGAGRSMLGRAGDAVGAAKDKISDVWFNKFGGMLQSSGPVQAFDQKFEEIKASIAAKNPELAAKLAKYGEFAKANPKLHKFLLGIAGSAAAALGVALAGGIGATALAVGTGTAIAVGIVNIADRLLQGQKASTAIGRGATAGMVAGITAAGAAKLADLGKDLVAQIGVMKGAGEGVKTFNIIQDNLGVASMPGFERGINIAGKTEDIQQLRDLWNQFSGLAWDLNKTPGGDTSAMYDTYKQFASLVGQMKDPAYIDGLQLVAAQQQQAIEWVNSAFTAINGAAKIATTAGAATVGQAAAGAGEKPAAPAVAPAPTTESLNRNQLNELFGITGNKIDASTLQKAWEKAKRPTDSDAVAKILQSAGVDPTVISKAYTDMSLPVPSTVVSATPSTAATGTSPSGATPLNTQDLLAQIKKLTPAEQKQILAYLKR